VSPASLNSALREELETLYHQWNYRDLVHPDPLEKVYLYHRKEDQEVVAYLTAIMAYGRVDAILKALDNLLSLLGPHPYQSLLSLKGEQLDALLKDFRYRFYSGSKLSRFLKGIGGILREYGSLESCFRAGQPPGADNYLPGLDFLQECIRKKEDGDWKHILTFSHAGGAQKRLHLFLRWMIRKDRVDLGLWDFSPHRLLIPLDTHMHQVSLELGLTKRKQSDCKAVLEITEALRGLCPQDPVKYDFALTRAGIRTNYF